jgi:hypothetical protein
MAFRAREAILNHWEMDMPGLRARLQDHELRVKNVLPAVCRLCLQPFSSVSVGPDMCRSARHNPKELLGA